MILCEFQIYEQYMMTLAEYMEAPTQGPFKSVTTVTLTHYFFSLQIEGDGRRDQQVPAASLHAFCEQSLRQEESSPEAQSPSRRDQWCRGQEEEEDRRRRRQGFCWTTQGMNNWIVSEWVWPLCDYCVVLISVTCQIYKQLDRPLSANDPDWRLVTGQDGKALFNWRGPIIASRKSRFDFFKLGADESLNPSLCPEVLFITSHWLRLTESCVCVCCEQYQYFVLMLENVFREENPVRPRFMGIWITT